MTHPRNEASARIADHPAPGRPPVARVPSAWPCVVVGGGPAGIAAATHLRRAGVAALVLEQGDVGHAWRGRYDRLRLNTSRLTARVAGAPFADGVGMFPTRDEFVAHLERLAARIEVREHVRVARIDRAGAPGRWIVRTSEGAVRTRHVVVATGYAREPFLPDWPGRGSFGGAIVHAAAYRDAAPFRGRDMLVVGAGCSGMEIAYDLARGGARRVRLAVRTPPNILLRSVGGLPGDPLGVALTHAPARIADPPTRLMTRLTVGSLREHGLPAPSEGPFARLARTGQGPAVVDREVIDAIRSGRVEVVAGLESFSGGDAILAGGKRVRPDAVVAATGYRCGLEPLAGHLGVLDARGVPRVTGGHEAEPGLRFVGFVPVPAQLRRLGIEGRRAARAIVREPAGGPAGG